MSTAGFAGFGGDVRENEPLSKHTYYRIGGPARAVLFPQSPEDLAWIAERVRKTGERYLVVGSGSNLLAPDEGFPGLIIKTIRLGGTEMVFDAATNLVRTGAGVAISSFLRQAGQAGWGGLEFLAGIPGSVGGAVFMNAGTHLGESGSALESVEAFSLATGEARTYAGAELRFEYRRNLFLPKDSLVTAASWRVRPGSAPEIKARIDDVLQRRKATQPIDLPSCGSVFKNPPGHHAWQVIDRLGLRGHRVGAAEFSSKHCNFIVNLGGARAADVRGLIELARTRARQELGIELEPEVVVVG